MKIRMMEMVMPDVKMMTSTIRKISKRSNTRATEERKEVKTHQPMTSNNIFVLNRSDYKPKTI